MRTLPAGLDNKSVEIFMLNGKPMAFYHRRVISFWELPEYLISILRNEMRHMPKYCTSIGIIHIEDENDRLEAYLAHRFPIFNNVPDIDENGNTNDELEGDNACRDRHITPREKEVIGLIALGYTDKQIANRLFISPLTVGRHRHDILVKTGFRNAADITRFACQKNIV